MVGGTILDQNGDPVIGASIVVKGTNQGLITDIDGNFSLNEVPENGVIQISFVGYKKQEVSVKGKSVLRVTLAEDLEVLDEVVVVGYGTQKKSDVTGAVSSVSAKDLTSRPVNNAFEALQGKAAGVDITSSERPGTVGSIRIRGNRSLTASNSPLYVVDGIPLLSGSGIETINPRDIESVDILKDASATAIYGSRGANGVVIITTKQGKDGQFNLNYAGTITSSNIVDLRQSMSAEEYITWRRWAYYNSDPSRYAHPDSPTMENDKALFNAGLDDTASWANVSKGWSNGKWDGSKVTSTDWADLVSQTGIAHEHTLSASGGTDKINGYGSFSYLKNDGTQKGQWYERYTGKASVNIKPKKWFDLSASLNASWSEQDYGMSTLGASSSTGPNSIYGKAKAINSVAMPYNEEGDLIMYPGGNSQIYTIVDEWNKSTQQSQTFRALGSFSAAFNFGEMYKPLKGLKYKISFGPDFRHWREGVYIDGSSANRVGGNNYARLRNRRDFSWTLDNMVNYDRTIANNHKVGVTLLQTASAWNIEESSMNAEKIARPSYLWNAFGTIDLTNPDSKPGMSSGITERQITSYMARFNYGYKERYLVTATGRWDGASQLADGNKWDFFPSLSIAWRVNEEGFLNDVTWLDNLKVRAGVGITGNSSVAPYDTKGAIQSILIPFNGGNEYGYTTNEPFYSKDQLVMANPDLGWERTTQYNVGIDFGVLGNRISGGVDFYTSITNDLIMSMKIPTLTGFSSTLANVGKTKNKGVEFTLNAIPVQTSTGFTWETNFNAAFQKDEIAELAYGKNDMVDNAWFIGESIGVYYGYANNGLWQDTAEDREEMAKFNAKGHNFSPGMVRPVDQNGDYLIDGDDRTILGNKTPRWTMGWSNTFSYKGLDLGITMLGRFGYTVSALSYGQTGVTNQEKIDYWTPNNTNAEYQKPIFSESGGDGFSSLLSFRDAAFLKVRNISLGYNLPKKVTSKMGIGNLKVYGQAINPFSLYQSIENYDLDVNSTTFNRSFVFGIEIGF